MKYIMAMIVTAVLCLSACEKSTIDWNNLNYGACQIGCDEDGHYQGAVAEARK